MSQHRIGLVQRLHPRPELLRTGLELARKFSGARFVVRKEFVQRRVEGSDRDRKPVHRLEDAFEILALQSEQALESALIKALGFRDLLLQPGAQGAQFFALLRRSGALEIRFRRAQFPLQPLVVERPENHLAHIVDSIPLEKHVFGAAQTDPFSAKAGAPRSHPRGVSALVRTRNLRC